MPGLVLLIAGLVTNFIRHRMGRTTICSTSRKVIGPRVFVLGWAALTAWFIPHYCLPFKQAHTPQGVELDE